MKTYLTIADLMLRLRIPQSNYTHFRNWCHKNKDKLDTQLCKWNNGYMLYNVQLVREKYPFPERFGLDKVSTPETIETPAETPLDAAERLAAAINTATGKNITGADIMAAFHRGKDYIRMRRQMARTLWRMRKARKKHSFWCQHYAAQCRNFYTACDNAALACDKRSRELRDNERVACRAAAITVILYIVTALAFLSYVLS